MRSSMYRRRCLVLPLIAAACMLALAALLPARAQPPAPDKALPEEARGALEDFLLSQDQPQPQQIPFPIFQVFLPLVIQVQGVDGAPPPPPPQADIAATLRPEPSIRVARSSDLVYTITVRNFGSAQADQVRVTLPIEPGQLDLLNFGSAQGDFVSVDEPGRTVVTFGPVEANGRRSASLLYAVNDSLPDDTVIGMRADIEWDGPTGGTTISNWAPVLVGSFNNTSRYVFLSIAPESGPAGSFFNAFSDRFIPDEPIVAWFNTPDGLEPLDRELTADAFGRISFSFSSAGFAPGSYELVLFGQRSKLTAVQMFAITAP